MTCCMLQQGFMFLSSLMRFNHVNVLAQMAGRQAYIRQKARQAWMEHSLWLM